VIIGFGAYMPLLGLYYYLCATKTPNFVGDVIGHLIPGSFVALFAQLSLRYYKKRDFLSLQRVEATIMIVAGFLDTLLHIFGNHGSIFRAFWEVNTNWMKDEQHILDLAVWIVSGTIPLPVSLPLFLMVFFSFARVYRPWVLSCQVPNRSSHTHSGHL
jgi:hypothetical protein